MVRIWKNQDSQGNFILFYKKYQIKQVWKKVNLYNYRKNTKFMLFLNI